MVKVNDLYVQGLNEKSFFEYLSLLSIPFKGRKKSSLSSPSSHLSSTNSAKIEKDVETSNDEIKKTGKLEKLISTESGSLSLLLTNTTSQNLIIQNPTSYHYFKKQSLTDHVKKKYIYKIYKYISIKKM